MNRKEPEPGEIRRERLLIAHMAAGGDGLARYDGLAVLIPGALPGEEVLAELRPAKGGWARGRLLEVLKPSPWRIEPDCPWAGRCGGCDLWAIEPSAAWPLKARAALGRLAEERRTPLRLAPAPKNRAYRTRVTFQVGPSATGERPVAVGFHPRRGHTVIGLGDCRLPAPELAALLPALNAWAATLPPGLRADFSFTLGLEPGEGLVGLLSPAIAEPPQLSAWRQASLGLKALAGRLTAAAARPVRLFLARPDRPPAAVEPGLGPGWVTVAAWPEWGLRLQAGPGAFSQVNPDVNRLLVRKVVEEAQGLLNGFAGRTAPLALDLYSGLGNFALPLAARGWSVTGVEAHPGAVNAARRNAQLAAHPGIKSSFRMLKGDAAKQIGLLLHQGYRPQLVVLDPPRAGARNLGPALAGLEPAMIQYISCHPAALARDLAVMASLGYALKSLTAFDMFPRTGHVEALAVLEPVHK